MIVGLGGEDFISGGGGDDLICGSGGSDRIYGGKGHDRLFGGAGGDALSGGPGNDRLYGGDHRDGLYGGAGGDVLYGGGDRDHLSGGWSRDRLYGGGGRDYVSGDRGIDHVDGGPMRDAMWFRSAKEHGGAGVRLDLGSGELKTVDGEETVNSVEDVRHGSPYNDVLLGSEGRDILGGGGGIDRVAGRGGNDVVKGEVASGGPGEDYVVGHYARGYGTVAMGGGGNDFLVGSGSYVVGHSGDDTIWIPVGPVGNESVAMWARGGPGNDRFNVLDGCASDEGGCANHDIRLDGDDGTDLVSVTEDEDQPVGAETYRFDLPAGQITQPTSGIVIGVSDFETVVGSEYDDTIIGTRSAELLMGARGDDTIRAAGGADVLAGGTRSSDDGIDELDAGVGTDTCYSSSPAGPPDAIERCETQRQVPVAR